MSNAKRIVIVGGGTAGLTVASQLVKSGESLDITVIEPSEKHYYQPLWTLVGAGIFPKEESEREEIDYMPGEVSWVKDHVESFDPDGNAVVTRGGQSISYDALVVCPGLQLNWDQIKGLSRNLVGTQGICSNYSYETVEYTFDTLKSFTGGTALFTHPLGPVKCGGAPVKICFLAEDYFRNHGMRDKSQVIFAAAMPRIFAVDKYARTLESAVERRGIDVRLNRDLIEIRPESREAVFQLLESDETEVVKYDMIHIAPKMGSPDFVKNSPLAASEGGWVDVDKFTTQHVRYSNIFALGDVSNLADIENRRGNSQAGSGNGSELDRACFNGQPLEAKYDGYTSCPLVTELQQHGSG